MYHETTRTAQGTAGAHRNAPASPGCRYQCEAGGHLDAPSAVAAGSIIRGLWDYSRDAWAPDIRPVPSIVGRS